MGLLPEGEQNALISPDASFQEILESYRNDPRPGLDSDSIESMYSWDVGTGTITLHGGRWRADCGPIRIVATSIRDGRVVEVRRAELLVLAGERGWGTYYFDGGVTAHERRIVTADGARGRVSDQYEWRW